jgi:hypothetical protein
MLSSFDLLDRAVYKDTIPQSIENAVDFTKFNNLSRDLRDKSKTFLLDAIKSSL